MQFWTCLAWDSPIVERAFVEWIYTKTHYWQIMIIYKTLYMKRREKSLHKHQFQSKDQEKLKHHFMKESSPEGSPLMTNHSRRGCTFVAGLSLRGMHTKRRWKALLREDIGWNANMPKGSSRMKRCKDFSWSDVRKRRIQDSISRKFMVTRRNMHSLEMIQRCCWSLKCSIF